MAFLSITGNCYSFLRINRLRCFGSRRIVILCCVSGENLFPSRAILSQVVVDRFLRRSGSRVSIPIACRRQVSTDALSLSVFPIPLGQPQKTTRPLASDRFMCCQPRKTCGRIRGQKNPNATAHKRTGARSQRHALPFRSADKPRVIQLNRLRICDS